MGVVMPRTLRVATEGEQLPKPKTIVQAAADGDRRELLVALRTRLAQAVQDERTPPRDLAALSRRLVDVDREIEAIDAEAADDAEASIPDEAFDASAL